MQQLLLVTLSRVIVVITLISHSHCYAVTFPLQFSIPETKIVKEIPLKDRDCAFIIPGDLKTYIYTTESDYYQDYQRSYFGITCKKGGWDCMRHYEILANGCIPYFIDIDQCNPNTMAALPKDLIMQAMHLEGVSYSTAQGTPCVSIDHTKFNKEKYYELLHKLLEHTRKYLTTRAMAQYVLNSIRYAGTGNILFLSKEVAPDYMRECVLIGLKEIFQEKVVDFPKIDFLYKTYQGDIRSLYGKGFTYSKNLDDLIVDRNNIEQRIKNREFDLIVYGSVHRGLLFHDLVLRNYPADKIVYLCGEDAHKCEYSGLPQMFLREFDAR